ncbi:carotenoid cleavage dioxygenase [Chloropicon primus]|uniref:carotenoid 9,10-dioxygenase n=2 Tax=Chloropicon primus TaxID=1764295 RepID=A0A5B8MNY2_9CHLO|nr:carotenoid cleavage dioxygenase [Chloropicon primus]UPR01241.1 carotenoid cleavage dioxygenase [Chloropicon primus]|eukprot:QDZ22021.1 carotenoid cleavage dioxygenase [Chloropicon primus]
MDWFDKRFVYPGEPPEPVGFLKGNFAPTAEEVTLEDLEVTRGKLPDSLNGAYLRNGPNPYFKPNGKYHWFDGDAMVHGVRIKGGKASYANRYVDTARLSQEKAYGRAAFAKIGELTGKTGLLALLSESLKVKLGLLDKGKGSGCANTSLAFHGDKLLALYESDLPYEIKVMCTGAIETIGRATITAAEMNGGRKAPKGFDQFTAHPKRDERTGELHFFGYNLREAPHLNYGVLDRAGNLVRSIPIDLPHGPAMMHDMALTETYAVFLYMPLYFRPKEMVGGEGFPFVFDPEMPSKFALLPRCAEDASQIQWFDLPSGMIFHTSNAWDDQGDGRVHLYACSTSTYKGVGDLISSNSTRSPRSWEQGVERDRTAARFLPGAHGGLNVKSLGEEEEESNARTNELLTVDFAVNFKSGKDLLNLSGSDEVTSSTSLLHFTFDPRTGIATQAKILDPKDCGNGDAYLLDFPTINPRYLSKRQKYVYLATFCDGMKTNGVVKCDVLCEDGEDRVRGRIHFGSGRFGGECTFVPRDGGKEEDDGYLTTFVYDDEEEKSFLVVYDARTMSEVAEVDVGVRVPYGFHGLWVDEGEMRRIGGGLGLGGGGGGD